MGFRLIVGVGGGVEYPANTTIRLNTYKYKLKNYCVYWESDNNSGYAVTFQPSALGLYKKCLVLRNVTALPATLLQSRIVAAFEGNFNYDSFSFTIPDTFLGRVEIRNDEGVLIIDNGRPWSDGTYPPDAKNRAEVAGPHAAPVASSNEFADLSRLDPNKEEEITIGERGAGIEHALEGE